MAWRDLAIEVVDMDGLVIDKLLADCALAPERLTIVLTPTRFAPHAAVQALIAGYERIVAPLARRCSAVAWAIARM